MKPGKNDVGTPNDKPVIPTRGKRTATCAPPVCASCHLARQHRRGAGSSKTVNKPQLEMAIRRNDLKPGDYVSTDQYVSAKPGRLPHTRGRERVAEQYHGGTLFYDHATAYIWLTNQVLLTAGETIKSKHAFERWARSHGVSIKKYRADNHPYSSNAFINDIEMRLGIACLCSRSSTT